MPLFLHSLMLHSLLATGYAGWAPVVTDRRAYSAAIADLAGGRLEDAEAGFAAILAKDPDCGMALHGRGMARLRSGALDGAAADLQQVASRFPERPEGHTALSSVRFAQQDFVAAEAAARAAVQADPSDIDANAALQQVLLRTGDLPAARAALKAVGGALPPPVMACFEVQLAREAGDTAGVEAGAERCGAAGIPGLVAAALSRATGDVSIMGELAGELGVEDLLLHAQAVDLFNDGAYAEAAATLDTVLARSPHRVDARLLRARSRHATGAVEGALSDLEQAFDAPTWVDVHRSGAMSGILRRSDADALDREVVAGAGLLVQILLEKGDLDGARSRLDAFDAALGDRAPLQAARADWRFRSGDVAGGWAHLEASLQRHPGDAHLLRLASLRAVTQPEGMPAGLRAMLGASGSWQDAWNLALSQRKGGDLAGCHATAAGALTASATTATPDDRRKLAGLAHRCAVSARDRTGADALVAEAGGAASLDPVVAYNHALLRYESGDAHGTLTLLGSRVGSPDAAAPDATRATVALAIRAHLDLDALSAAHDLAVGGWATPEDQLVVASRLAVADDPVRARALLDVACPVLSGEAQSRCDKLMEVLSEVAD